MEYNCLQSPREYFSAPSWILMQNGLLMLSKVNQVFSVYFSLGEKRYVILMEWSTQKHCVALSLFPLHCHPVLPLTVTSHKWLAASTPGNHHFLSAPALEVTFQSCQAVFSQSWTNFLPGTLKRPRPVFPEKCSKSSKELNEQRIPWLDNAGKLWLHNLMNCPLKWHLESFCC